MQESPGKCYVLTAPLGLLLSGDGKAEVMDQGKGVLTKFDKAFIGAVKGKIRKDSSILFQKKPKPTVFL